MKRGVSVPAAAAPASCGTPALKYCTTSFTRVNEPLWKKNLPSLSCRSVKHAELEGVAVTGRDFPPAIIAEVGILSASGIQGLERVVGESEIVEVLFHELTGPGHVRVVNLLVEHRAAVAGVAACATIRSRA